MKLTGIKRSESGSVVKGTAIIRSMLQVVIIEGKRRRFLQILGVIARPTLLDGGAVGTAGSAGPVQSRLESGVVGVVLGYAPQLQRDDAVLGLGLCRQGVEWESDGEKK